MTIRFNDGHGGPESGCPSGRAADCGTTCFPVAPQIEERLDDDLSLFPDGAETIGESPQSPYSAAKWRTGKIFQLNQLRKFRS